MNKFSKKEIYFTKDVFRNVSEKNKVNPKIVEGAFNSFVKYFKQNIEDTDNILYPLPYLGEMMITHGDALREMDKFRKRASRERNKEEKARLLKVSQNYRVRVKKIRIELEKTKRMRIHVNRDQRKKLWTRKYGLSRPENIKRKENFMNHTLEEVMNKQNEYAYKHYKEKNLPVTL